MAKQSNESKEQLNEPAGVLAETDSLQDEYYGIGGSYVIDPVTGKRTPAPPEQ
jgi:hypothetical protein